MTNINEEIKATSKIKKGESKMSKKLQENDLFNPENYDFSPHLNQPQQFIFGEVARDGEVVLPNCIRKVTNVKYGLNKTEKSTNKDDLLIGEISYKNKIFNVCKKNENSKWYIF